MAKRDKARKEAFMNLWQVLIKPYPFRQSQIPGGEKRCLLKFILTKKLKLKEICKLNNSKQFNKR